MEIYKSEALCVRADQPDVFLQRMLKQTRAYLTERSPESRRKFEEGFQEAAAKAAAVTQDPSTAPQRNFDM